RMALPAGWASTLDARRGQEIVVGIRPEDLSLETVAAGGTIGARADVREPLGNEVLMHWDTPVGPLVSRIPGQHAPGVGESATLHFAWDRLHLFDVTSEQALEV
ncbi:MAG: TOBE domain-containing protein, partial [Candidatus Eisenbacteria bacterium]